MSTFRQDPIDRDGSRARADARAVHQRATDALPDRRSAIQMDAGDHAAHRPSSKLDGRDIHGQDARAPLDGHALVCAR